MPSRRTLLAALLLATTATACGSSSRLDTSATGVELDRGQALSAFAQLPLAFGRDGADGFVARGSGYTLALGPSGSRLSLAGLDRPLETSFVDARLRPRLEASAQLPGRANYLVGDPSRWRTGIRSYAHVTYREVWPGIDVAYRGDQHSLEYDYRVAPGADPRRIAVAYSGADDLRIAPGGDLIVTLPGGGTVREQAPRSFQDGRPVPSHFVMRADDRVGIATGAYDRSRPLLIDPELSFGTYLGGAGVDGAGKVAVDEEGSIYVVGIAATGFPTTNGVFQDTAAAGGDAFVTKLAPDGGSLVYSTFIGGGAQDVSSGIAIRTEPDPEDAEKKLFFAYVAGTTKSTDFPTTADAPQKTKPSAGSDSEGFVAKLNPDGSELLYSTYLGGDGADVIADLALNDDGEAWVVGTTESSAVTFPTTASLSSRAGTNDGFVTRVSATGNAFAFSSFLGGNQKDRANGIALDATGNPTVAGETESTDFPTTAGVVKPAIAAEPCIDLEGIPPSPEAFVTRLGAGGTTIADSTYLGGKCDDRASDVALDGDGNVYLAGLTVSTDFPATAGAFQTARANPSDGGDAFVAKLTPTLSALTYASYLGGNILDSASGIALDDDGIAYVVGLTYSPNFPVSDDAAQSVKGADGGGFFGAQDGFMTAFNADGSDVETSTYLGGNNIDYANGVTVNADGTAIVAGETYATDFPGTAGGLQSSSGGQDDAFIVASPSRRETSTSVACAPPSVLIGKAVSCTATVTDSGTDGTTPTGTVGWSSSEVGSFSAGSCDLTGSGATTTCSVTYTPTVRGSGAHKLTGAYSGDPDHQSSTGTATIEVRTPPGPPGDIPVKADDLDLSDNAFRADDSGPSATASRAPVGTTVSYTLTEAAQVRFTVQRPTKGRKVNGKCVKQKKKNRKKKRCTRYKKLKGSFTLNGAAGANSFRFSGRLRNRKLKPGRYRLVATPVVAGEQVVAAMAKFRIVR